MPMPFDVTNLVYRGDDREPGLIFPFGFSRRKNTWGYFEKLWQKYFDDAFNKQFAESFQAHQANVQRKEGEEKAIYKFRAAFGFTPNPDVEVRPNFRYTDADRSQRIIFQDDTGKSRAVTIRLDKSPRELYAQWIHDSRKLVMRAGGDLDLESGVCETPELTVAALFPLPSDYPQSGTDETWIYVVYNDGRSFQTYQKQIEKAKEPLQSPAKSKILNDLARSKEIADYDVPSGYVFAAVKCRRKWTVKLKKFWREKADWRQGVQATLVPPIQINEKIENQEDLTNRLKPELEKRLDPWLGKSFECMAFKDLPDEAVLA